MGAGKGWERTAHDRMTCMIKISLHCMTLGSGRRGAGAITARHGHMLSVFGSDFAVVLQVIYVQTSACLDRGFGKEREVHGVVVDEPSRGTLSLRSCGASFGMRWLGGP